MATVTLQVDDDVLKKAGEMFRGSDWTLDKAFEQTLREIAERDEASRQFEAMADQLAADGWELPILGREERNARR